MQTSEKNFQHNSSASTYHVNSTRTLCFNHSFVPDSIKIWNYSVVDCKTLDDFKHILA